MKRVGIPIAVADAHEKVRERALLVTRATGGHGAVREICEQILKSQGLWETTVSRFEA
jgi:3-deoxy-D-manno-octulosonate 8-phosphate phosphatase (KDO 8-P phosphatase)